MERVPKKIIKKIEQYISYTQKAQIILADIDKWMTTKHGIDSVNVTDKHSNDYDEKGAIIQDILIDAPAHGDLEETIRLINEELNNEKID